MSRWSRKYVRVEKVTQLDLFEDLDEKRSLLYERSKQDESWAEQKALFQNGSVYSPEEYPSAADAWWV